MKLQRVLIFSSVIFVLAVSAQAEKMENSQVDMTDAMKESIVYLETSFYGYEQFQPWRNKELARNWAIGCAISKNEVLTTAWNVANLAFIRARAYGQNEFIPAKIKLVDYESNLAIITLDANAMSRTLKPLKFSEKYSKGDQVSFYWLSAGGHLYSGRGFLDRAQVYRSNISYAKGLNFVVANASDRTGIGQVYFSGKDAIGIACWSEEKENGIIPGEVINRFLEHAEKDNYKGFGARGFSTSELLDPAMRDYLKMPGELTYGVYVSDVFTIGTGSDCLNRGDVILSMDGKQLNPYGRFMHEKYGRLYFDHLITSRGIGEKIEMTIWRDAATQRIEAEIKNFDVAEMLVPYYEFDAQPEYIVLGGFIFQKLTRQYMAELGSGWVGKISPHIYHYFRDMAFKPGDERKSIIVLSYVLPADINLGYGKIGQLVVDNINGMKISAMKDIPEALKLNPEAKYDVIEFEMDNPKVVIDRTKLAEADAIIAENYGITKLSNINDRPVK